MNNNNNNEWIKEYINEKKFPNGKNSFRMRKPKTDYGIGFVQMNKVQNNQTKRSNDKPYQKPRPITMNELLKNSLRFENVMRLNRVCVPKSIDRPL